MLQVSLKLDYSNSENNLVGVTANDEYIGEVSNEDVPYLTRKSIDELFYDRIREKVAEHFNVELWDVSITSHYISGSGYLARS